MSVYRTRTQVTKLVAVCSPCTDNQILVIYYMYLFLVMPATRRLYYKTYL